MAGSPTDSTNGSDVSSRTSNFVHLETDRRTGHVVTYTTNKLNILFKTVSSLGSAYNIRTISQVVWPETKPASKQFTVLHLS